jgi:hypothetical protein
MVLLKQMGDSLCILFRLNCGSNCLRWIVEFTAASSLFRAWNLFSFTNIREFSMFICSLGFGSFLPINLFMLGFKYCKLSLPFLTCYFFIVLCFFVYSLLLLWILILWEKILERFLILFLLLNLNCITLFSLIYCMFNDWFSSHPSYSSFVKWKNHLGN